MTISAPEGGENMSDKIYNGTVKERRGIEMARRVLLSIIGMGAAYIMGQDSQKEYHFR